MTVFSAIVAVIGAIPALEAFFQSLMAFYISSQIDKLKAEHLIAIKQAIEGHDQREIEKLMGSEMAGKPSGIGSIVHSIPGLPASDQTASASIDLAKQRPTGGDVSEKPGS